MRRLVLLVGVAALALLMAAPAQATTMREWKGALEQATVQYGEVFWSERIDPSVENGLGIGLSSLLTGFDPYCEGWGYGAMDQCCYVLALYGEFPCDGIDWNTFFNTGRTRLLPYVKDFLRPWLNGPIPQEQLRLLYRPPVLDLTAPTAFGR